MSIESQLEALLRLVIAGSRPGSSARSARAPTSPPGTRTFAVVGIGACLVTLGAEQAFAGAADAVSRVTAQVVTGIGFLGAGTIMQVKARADGLTTAAGIWAVAAVGIAFGHGLYVLAAGTTVVLLVAFAVIGHLLPTKPYTRTDG